MALLIFSSLACRAATAAAAFASLSSARRCISLAMARSCSCAWSFRCSFSDRVSSRYARKATHLASFWRCWVSSSSAFLCSSLSSVRTTLSNSRLRSASSLCLLLASDSWASCALRRSSSRRTASRCLSATCSFSRASIEATTCSRSLCSSSTSCSFTLRCSAICPSSRVRKATCFFRPASRCASSSLEWRTESKSMSMSKWS
mmetsp:Transcript_31709/g.91041  ORF Transcript_31709/g.91041 Transcript_31709/m.91041 type:complete len:203 (+) Transcript_31709:590-1198(+)